jgi:hypothetical protein
MEIYPECCRSRSRSQWPPSYNHNTTHTTHTNEKENGPLSCALRSIPTGKQEEKQKKNNKTEIQQSSGLIGISVEIFSFVFVR